MHTDFTTPLAGFGKGSTHHGFLIERVEELPEIGGHAYVMRHETTGARALWLACPDTNKAFSIAFKTPPANDTGVFHILEHSVLCGSDRFPVKDPFVHLIKSSMQTFLNAMTFPDKTMYPVASTNERDLENLMDIYLDAVLHPAIYKRPRIFAQEGWHLELEGPDAPLTYNGVVYNEMKGALSNPEEIMLGGINRALFGETPYGWVSGGDPNHIPELSYEEFLDTHARHYQLSNSYTVLYGDLDIEGKLAFLDERFCAAEQRGAGAPNALVAHEPQQVDLVQIPMHTTPDNACVGVAYVFADASQRERVLAADVMLDALIGSNEAPLKRAILKAGLGSDVSGFLYDGILQPMLIFELRGAKPGCARTFAELIDKTCAQLVERGLGHDNLEASLAQAEFNLREGDWGYPDGVGLAIQAMSGWLYNDDDAVTYLRYETELDHLRSHLDDGYFEQLLGEAVCSNDYRCCVEVVPQDEATENDEAGRLAKIRAAMDEVTVAKTIEETSALHEEQAAPDTQEAIATLPHLTLADIGEGPQDPETRRVEAPVPCYHHDIDTHHITYAYWYFDLSCLTYEELPYASVLCSLLGKLDTQGRSAFDLDTICESKLGNLSFFTEVYSADDDGTTAWPKLVVGASALSHNVGWLATLPQEIWDTTVLDDPERIADILEQRRVGMEMAFVDSGHAAALARVSSQFVSFAVVVDALGGVEFYRFLRNLLDGLGEHADELVSKLRSVAAKVFTRKNCEMSLTGPAEDVERFWECAGDLSLAEGANAEGALVVPAPRVRNEALIVPSNVCYVAEGMDGSPLGVEPSGAWSVARKALSFDYLWNEVRVLGGAYGCGLRCTADRLLELYSYRDPAVDPTVRRFEQAGDWLAAWQPSPAELEGYIVSCVAGMDAPVKPRALGRRLDAERLSRREEGWRERRRAQMLACTADEVRELAAPLRQLADRRGICVFGGREQIEGASAELNLEVCELFGEQGN